MSGGATERSIRMCDINEMITCKICSGYLIDATTIVECLHTFCKSCIVKHLNSDDNNTCPQCDEVIHQSHPLNFIKFDRTMQDLVYKLVPNLEKNEYKRERDFYAEKGVPCPKDVEAETEKDEKLKKEEEDQTPDVNTNLDYHRFDEQVNLVLEPKPGSGMKELKRKFVRCSSLATITHLKKFIALRCLESMENFRELDITCDGELIPKDHTLKFVYITRWRTKPPPLKLMYSPKIDVEHENEEVEKTKKTSKNNQAPQWKLQPKLNYDDDDDES
ncbi:polycomb group RING finger protein 3 [Eurytemora carolleeae]|uniref:polycomb group RING finger protein 3 n=1 Tax=Eurytemora carolleeae TaxID=1294199 RepID=UPI000C7711AA|nr:polycomb group RING finger protein 3 [Eurytemora carolleeae]|eukprot:XP_023327768.1 polycomb group RING finger protein 3-like [Eurytemora affinis]